MNLHRIVRLAQHKSTVTQQSLLQLQALALSQVVNCQWHFI